MPPQPISIPSSPLPSIQSTTDLTFQPLQLILDNILKHQKERKAADDEAARHLKDKMIVEYRNQSEQHELLTTTFVGALQNGIPSLVTNLLALTQSQTEDEIPSEEPESRPETKYTELINNYIINHLGVYQKAVKKHKLNSRQRTDRFSGKAFVRYNETLEKDEKELLDMFSQLKEAYDTIFPSEQNSSLPDQEPNSVKTPLSSTTKLDLNLNIKLQCKANIPSKSDMKKTPGNNYGEDDVEMLDIASSPSPTSSSIHSTDSTLPKKSKSKKRKL